MPVTLNTKNEALAQVVKHFGSVQAAAHEARVTDDTIRYWLSNHKAPRTAARLLAMLVYPDEPYEDFERELATNPSPEPPKPKEPKAPDLLEQAKDILFRDPGLLRQGLAQGVTPAALAHLGSERWLGSFSPEECSTRLWMAVRASVRANDPSGFLLAFLENDSAGNKGVVRFGREG